MRTKGPSQAVAALVLILAAGCEQLPDSLPGLKDAAPLFESLELSSEAPEEGIYSYVNEAGRTVYVSHEGLIPPGKRSSSTKVDLSHVSLNEELGNELNEAAAKEHAALASTDLCAETQVAAEDDLVTHVIKTHPHWIGIGAVILLLLLTAPWVARHVGAGRWVRVLCLTLPLLLFLGVLTQTARTAHSTLAELRTTSDLCGEERLAEEPTTAGKLSVVRELRSKLMRIQREREEKMERILREAR